MKEILSKRGMDNLRVELTVLGNSPEQNLRSVDNLFDFLEERRLTKADERRIRKQAEEYVEEAFKRGEISGAQKEALLKAVPHPLSGKRTSKLQKAQRNLKKRGISVV